MPIAHPTISQLVRRFTKSRKALARNCGQIGANRVRASALQLGHAFAIAGLALLFDALLPFGLSDHRGQMPYWSVPAAALVHRAYLAWLLEYQKHWR
jgi:hypothetical protein